MSHATLKLVNMLVFSTNTAIIKQMSQFKTALFGVKNTLSFNYKKNRPINRAKQKLGLNGPFLMYAFLDSCKTIFF